MNGGMTIGLVFIGIYLFIKLLNGIKSPTMSYEDKPKRKSTAAPAKKKQTTIVYAPPKEETTQETPDAKEAVEESATDEEPAEEESDKPENCNRCKKELKTADEQFVCDECDKIVCNDCLLKLENQTDYNICLDCVTKGWDKKKEGA